MSFHLMRTLRRCRAGASLLTHCKLALPVRAMGTVGGSIQPFLLADIGEGIAEVEVLQWYCQEGEQIEMFDKVCEVQSDKATVDISSKFDGVVTKLHYEVGDMAKVGAPLIDVQTSDQADDESPAANPMVDGNILSALEALWAATDTNSDGKVSRAELIAALKVNTALAQDLGLNMHIQEGSSRDAFEIVFQGMDSDMDKSITLPEWLEWHQRHGQTELRQLSAAPPKLTPSRTIEPISPQPAASPQSPVSTPTAAAAPVRADTETILGRAARLNERYRLISRA